MRRDISLALTLTLMPLGGCYVPDTALVVFIDSDMPLERIEVDVTGTDGRMAPTSVTMDFRDADPPVWLTLVPDDGHVVDEPIEIEIAGYLVGASDASVVRTATTRFELEETLALTLYLFEVCATSALTCPDGQTCLADATSVTGTCVTDQVDAYEYEDDPEPL